jgi:hypothetical protein
MNERRRLIMLLRLLALIGVLGVLPHYAAAADKDDTHEGVVVKAADDKLTIADKDVKETTFDVGKSAQITLDGKACKLEDLKKGVKVKVKLSANSPQVGAKKQVVRIDANTK